MKKTAWPLALCIALLLWGCSGPAAESAGSDVSGAGAGETAIDPDYAYGNMQKNVPSGNFVEHEGQILFLSYDPASSNTTLFTFDPETEEVSTFCKDATCSHTSSTCASGGITTNLEACGGTVYGGTLGGAVLELRGDRFETVTDGGVSHFWHSGGDLYVATMDSSLLVYEEGSSQPRTLLEEYTGYWETVFGDTLYFQSDGMRSIGLNSGDQEAAAVTESADAVTDGRHVYYAPADTLALHRCNMDGSEATQLLEDPVMPASWNFDQEYFYFRLFSDGLDGQESENIYRLSLEDPGEKELLAALPEPAYQIYTVPGYGKLFVTSYSGGAGQENIYLVDKATGDFTLLEMPAR